MEKQKRMENGFKALGLSDAVYEGTVRLGFRVSFVFTVSTTPVVTSLVPRLKDVAFSLLKL